MKRTVPFFLATLIFGWILQALFLYWVPAGLPTPHWFLLAVLALGAQGRTRFAMTVGFVGGVEFRRLRDIRVWRSRVVVGVGRLCVRDVLEKFKR